MLVVLSFDDEDEALNLVDAVLEDHGVFYANEKTSMSRARSVQAQAIYKWPTQFHEPHETHGAGKTGQAFQLGQKFGWWICAVCKKPSRMYWETIVQKQSSFGKNLLSTLFDLEASKKKEEEPV